LGGEDRLLTVEGRARAGNPKGNYESRDVIQINNTILARSGGSWHTPPPVLATDAADANRIRAFCAGLAHDCPAGCPRWGWKDPRTVLTLDVWLAALQVVPFIVASYRHPGAVARSLEARNRMPITVGLALWRAYTRALLGHLERYPHALVRYDGNRESVLSQTIDASRRAGLRADEGVLSHWFDPALVRSSRDEDEPLPAEVASLWERLQALHAGE
jgi:hypothetical protein